MVDHSDSQGVSVSDIDGRRFVTTANAHGLSTSETIFKYFVVGLAIHGAYRGGEIADGQLIGRVTGSATFDVLFQCRTAGQELLSGQSHGIVRRDPSGLLALDFEWTWLTGDRSGGTSHYIELKDSA